MSLIVDCSYPMMDEIRRLEAQLRFYNFVPTRVILSVDGYEALQKEISPMILDPKGSVEEIMGMKIEVAAGQAKPVRLEYEAPRPMIESLQ